MNNLDLDEIEARIAKVNNSPSPEAGWLTYFDVWDIERLVAELRAARKALEYYADPNLYDTFEYIGGEPTAIDSRYRPLIWFDNGRTARDALGNSEGE